MTGVAVAGFGLLTGWGEGLAALPADAAAAAGDRAIVPLPTPAVAGDRFRRATRECVLAVAAVEALRRDAGLDRAALSGPATGLLYATAAAYGASNRAFIEAASGALHFPYTAPSAVPAEVTIEYGLRGPYVTLIGGPTATIEALGQARRLLAGGACARVLVLAVETFAECADLWARAGRRVGRPLVEAAACVLLAPAADEETRVEAEPPADAAGLARRRAGETLACQPLIALGLGRAAGRGLAPIEGRWRGRRVALREG